MNENFLHRRLITCIIRPQNMPSKANSKWLSQFKLNGDTEMSFFIAFLFVFLMGGRVRYSQVFGHPYWYNSAKFHHYRICVTDFRDGGLFAPFPPSGGAPNMPILNRVKTCSNVFIRNIRFLMFRFIIAVHHVLDKNRYQHITSQSTYLSVDQEV